MDDVWIRAGLVAAALLVVGVVLLVLRWKESAQARRVSVKGLGPGIYLFTSTTCPTCITARERLSERVDVFEEIVWEEQPGLFTELGVDAVPAVLVVGEGGSGRLFPGQPDRVLREV